MANVWWIVVVACLVWYSSVTFYVMVRGAFDIKHMLGRLKTLRDDEGPDETA